MAAGGWHSYYFPQPESGGRNKGNCPADGPRVPIVAVGGTEDGDLGTDPLAIKEAIESLGTADGVLLLVDLGVQS